MRGSFRWYSLLALFAVVPLATTAEPKPPRVLSARQVEAVEAALTDPSVQLAALRWLSQSKFEDERLVAPVTKLLTHEKAEIRAAAAEALDDIGAKTAATVSALILLLKDKEPYVKQAAAHALGRIGEKAAAVPDLIALLKDNDPAVKWVAAEALGRIGEKAAASVPDLIALLQDADPNVRQAADDARYRIDKKAAQERGDLLKKNVIELKDPAKPVRSTHIKPPLKALDPSKTPQVVELVGWLGAFDPRMRQYTSALLRNDVEVSTHLLCRIVETTYGRSDERAERLLDAYLTASATDRPLLRWLGGRPSEELPVAGSDHSQRAELLLFFAGHLKHTADSQYCRDELARRTNELVDRESWEREDVPTLETVRDALRDAQRPNDAEAVQKQIDALLLRQKVIDWIKGSGYIILTHVAFWIALIGLYPRFRWVQAFFFWNFWVRNIVGAVYVPWVITLVPFLRHRLLMPFRESLIPRSFVEEFSEDSYFQGCRIETTKGGKTVSEKASEYVVPPLRGALVIEAPSGFGKTTLLRRFAKAATRPTVLLRAVECKDGVEKAIQERLHGIAADEKFLRTLVYLGGLDVLIDGLNEASPETRGLIGAFVNAHFKGHYVLTTQRLLGWSVPRAATLWRLQPVDETDVKEFLSLQWPRVEAAAREAQIDRAKYDRAVDRVLGTFDKSLDAADELCQFGPRTPMDATLIADLIARGKTPDATNLIAQYVDAARDHFRDAYPGREPDFKRVGERVLAAELTPTPQVDFKDLDCERQCLVEMKILLQRDGAWRFRHDRFRDYFMAMGATFKQALELRFDSRFTGIFEFLPHLLPPEEADELGDLLQDEAATTRENSAWLKYRQSWRRPKASVMITQFVEQARIRFHKAHPGAAPAFERVGERAFTALRGECPHVDCTGVEDVRDCLVETRLLVPCQDGHRFRKDEIRDYFIAMFISKDQALDVRNDERFAGVFEFLPKFLSHDDANALGEVLKRESESSMSAHQNTPPRRGADANTAWGRYKRNWRSPASGTS